MSHITISFLRQSGYKVAVRHHRYYNNNVTSPKGGMTEIIIDSPHGEHFEGVSKCCDQDNYNKKLGVRIALGRTGIKNHLSILR